MNTRIPDISFSPGANTGQQIDIIELSAINNRKPLLSHDPEQPHRVGFNLLCFIESGHGEHFVDFARYTYKPGDFLLINQNQVHAFDFSRNPLGKCILFVDIFLDHLSNESRNALFSPFSAVMASSPVFRLDQSSASSGQALISELVREFGRNDMRIGVMSSLLSALILILERSYTIENPPTTSKGRGAFDRFMLLLRNDYATNRDAHEYAEKIGTTYKTLNQLCKRFVGRTVKQLIDDYVILEIKRRSVTGEQSTQEIAFSMGFDDASNFVKYFKKHTGLTPRQFATGSKS
ncbi:MAG: helix-turn-helix transcriptional regulator [Pseudomonadota bacterium]